MCWLQGRYDCIHFSKTLLTREIPYYLSVDILIWKFIYIYSRNIRSNTNSFYDFFFCIIFINIHIYIHSSYDTLYFHLRWSCKSCKCDLCEWIAALKKYTTNKIETNLNQIERTYKFSFLLFRLIRYDHYITHLSELFFFLIFKFILGYKILSDYYLHPALNR